jgi:hypothetical protein
MSLCKRVSPSRPRSRLRSRREESFDNADGDYDCIDDDGDDDIGSGDDNDGDDGGDEHDADDWDDKVDEEVMST